MNSIAQLASERTSLSLFAPAPSTISFLQLTRNSSPADPSPTPSKALGTRNRLLRYGICVPCSKRLPLVRDAFSEVFGAKNWLFRYGRDIRYQKPPSGVRDAFSEAFGVKNRLLRYRRDIRYRKRPPTIRNEATGYDYCVAGSGWKMRPLPTTRRTPTP